jgi:hypothetical protein
MWPISDRSSATRPDLPESAAAPDRVRLSLQAQANLRIVSGPLVAATYDKSIYLPGMVVDRAGVSDRVVVTPVAGVVTSVHRFPGDTVGSGEPLFTVRVLSDAMQSAQTELFKATEEIEITEDTRRRLSVAASTGGIPQVRITEIDNELRRLAAAQRAYRLDLQTRGLSPHQIEKIGAGSFITEMQVVAPEQVAADSPPSAAVMHPNLFEMQELRVGLGQQVQAGAALCLLSHHQELYIEGRAFQKELPLIEQAIRESWPVDVEFMEDEPGRWPENSSKFTIRHVSNTIDPDSRTFAVYLPLANQLQTHKMDDRTVLMWRFRPGQRVRLHVRSERFEDVFVLPADAVVREGSETYAFRQDGNFFDRRPVHVVYRDRRHAIVANDGAIPPGVFVARSAASQLNRALKSAGASGRPHGHDHHNH